MPIKVGFLSMGMHVGGAERWMISLARWCDPNRIKWIGTALPEWSEEHPEMCRELANYMPIYGPPIRGDIRNHDTYWVRRPGPDASTGIGIVCSQADIVLSWAGKALELMAGYYRINYGIKVVAVSHGSWRHSMLEAQLAATHLAAVSQAAVNAFDTHVDKAKVEIIHNGIEIDRLAPINGREATRAKYGFKPEQIVLGYVGRLSEEKNPMAAALAAHHLGPKFGALYVGDGTYTGYRGPYIDEIKRLLPDRSACTGLKLLIGDELSAMDCFVNCSRAEAFSLSLLEAWWAGIPVVSTVTGAIPELEAKYGPLVVSVPYEPSPEQIAEGVMKALRPENQAIVKKAKQLVWEEFTAIKMAEKWTQYMERIVTEK
jgi:glycosyltransferase involved in cell wall biosynthesis